MKVGVIGAGSWGTALAVTAGRAGHAAGLDVLFQDLFDAGEPRAGKAEAVGACAGQRIESPSTCVPSRN